MVTKRVNTSAKGRELEDEVADIYRQLDGTRKVVQNTSISGVQVDVYVEVESKDGVMNRYAVDAKNFVGPVDSNHVRKCINDFSTLRNTGNIDRGVIVAANGFTKDAQASARDVAFVTLFDIRDLRLKISDFGPYLADWVRSYEEAPFHRNKMYIPLSGKNEDGQTVGNVEEYILNWLNGPGSHITLLGNYGTGKSTTLRHLMWLQARRYLDNPRTERVPIFVELKNFRQAPRTQALMTDILVNGFGITMSFFRFRELNEQGRFLIILDGFDEMVDRVLDGLPEEHFQELSSLASPRSKVILSCRTHYFKDHDEVLRLHEQETDLYRQVRNRAGFQILFLNPFTEKDIKVYLKSSFADDWTRYKKVIEETYDLRSLAEVPILLNMMVQTLPDMALRGARINRSAVYQSFTNRWLMRERWRRALNSDDRLHFCKQLALHFYKEQKNSVHWRELPSFVRQYFAERIKAPEDIDVFSSDVRTCNFLVREEQGGKYSFVHKSFMEFFVARHFVDAIRCKAPNGLDDLKDFARSRVIWEFLIEMLDREDVDFLRRDVFYTEKEDYAQLMSHRGIDSKRIYTSPESIGNCAYLLLNRGVALEGANLDSARLTGISLSSVSFAQTGLRGADFTGSKFHNVVFSGAQLNYAKFKNAEIKDVDFSHANLDHADFLHATIDTKSLESIAKSQHWGSIKIDPAYRRRIEAMYVKPGPVLTTTPPRGA